MGLFVIGLIFMAFIDHEIPMGGRKAPAQGLQRPIDPKAWKEATEAHHRALARWDKAFTAATGLPVTNRHGNTRRRTENEETLTLDERFATARARDLAASELYRSQQQLYRQLYLHQPGQYTQQNYAPGIPAPRRDREM